MGVPQIIHLMEYPIVNHPFGGTPMTMESSIHSIHPQYDGIVVIKISMILAGISHYQPLRTSINLATFKSNENHVFYWVMP